MQCTTKLHIAESLLHLAPFLSTQEAKNFPQKQKGLRDSRSYSTPQKSEERRGNAITQPRSHPIKKNVEFVCEIFRAHEMRSQLEVTDVNLTV